MQRLMIAKVALAALSAAALVACANAQGGSSLGAPRPSTAVQAQLQELYDLMWGTPRARQAVEVLAYVDRQEKLAECLAADGYAHVPAPFVDATAPARPALDWFDVVVPADEAKAAVDGFGPAAVAAEITPGKSWPGEMPPPEALRSCEEKTGGLESLPAVDPELDSELHQIVASAVKGSSAELSRTYPTCMRNAGHPVSEGRNELIATIEAQRSPGLGISSAEADAAAADARCRAGQHQEAMMALDSPLERFATDHADRLEELRSRPDELQEQARTAAERLDLTVKWL